MFTHFNLLKHKQWNLLVLQTLSLRIKRRIWYFNTTDLFWVWFFHSEFNLNLLQFSTCNIHSWSIDCYSSGKYLKRESSCAFLMDCACLPLLYMDRELVWRSVILFSQSPSALLFWEKNISTPYFSTTSKMTRLDDLESWWRWISLSFSSPSFSWGTLFWRGTTTFSCQGFHVKYPLCPLPILFMSSIFCVFHCMCAILHLASTLFSHCIRFIDVLCVIYY